MDYQVWIKDESYQLYNKVDCGDLPAAKREIDKAVRAGLEPVLTIEVPYELGIKVGEVGKEAPKHKPKPTPPGDKVEEGAAHEAAEDKT